MNQTAKPKPACHLCGDVLTRGLRLKRKEASSLFLCYGCHDLVKAVVEDELEEWTYKEGEKGEDS